MQLKIWHDDIRRPPASDWQWVRTNQAAIAALLEHGDLVTHISLDHDLGLHEHDPSDYEKPEELRASGEETGYDLVVAMCALRLCPPHIRIHTWNPMGAERMCAYLSTHKGGRLEDILVKPYTPSVQIMSRGSASSPT
jgi:hypothetical protein